MNAGTLVLVPLVLSSVVVVAKLLLAREVVVCAALLVDVSVNVSGLSNHDTLCPVVVGRCITLARIDASSNSIMAEVLGHQQGSGTVTVSTLLLS